MPRTGRLMVSIDVKLCRSRPKADPLQAGFNPLHPLVASLPWACAHAARLPARGHAPDRRGVRLVAARADPGWCTGLWVSAVTTGNCSTPMVFAGS